MDGRVHATTSAGRDAAGISGLVRVAVGAGAAWLLLAAAAIGAGDAATIGWVSLVLGLALGAIAIVRIDAVRRATIPLVGAILLMLVAATLVAGLQGWGAVDGRTAVLTGNANFLGAALVAAAAAWAALAPRRHLIWWVWPVVGLAVLYTGSRTSGAALLAAASVWLVLSVVAPRARLASAVALIAAVLALAALGWQVALVEASRNLLASPNDLSDAAWNRSRAASITFSPDPVPGPYEETHGTRMYGRAAPGEVIFVYQRVGLSEPDVPYVASIYFRADTAQEIVLSSNLARVSCSVDATWRRCVTPAALGNGVSQSQLQLRVPVQGGSFDLEVFGAQYERGGIVSEFEDIRPSWLPQAMLNRFDLRRITFLPENRLGTVVAGLAIAREHPWFGVGRSHAPGLLLERSTPPVTYVHNLPLHLLVVHGIVGALGWLLVAGTILAAAGRRGLGRLAPLLVALAVLNTWDVTLFEPLTGLPVLAAVAFWTRPEVVAEHGPSPRTGGAGS